MQIDKKILHALEAKSKEQSTELTQWVQKEFGLSAEYQVKARLTISVKRARSSKVAQNQQGWTFDQIPTPDDWRNITEMINKILEKGKPYQRSQTVWRCMLEELQHLQKNNNVAHVCYATRLNVHLQNNNQPYRLVRVDKTSDEGALYSLLVANKEP